MLDLCLGPAYHLPLAYSSSSSSAAGSASISARSTAYRAVGAFRSRREPVILFGRHQHELPPAVARNLDRLAPSLMLKLADFAHEPGMPPELVVIASVSEAIQLCCGEEAGTMGQWGQTRITRLGRRAGLFLVGYREANRRPSASAIALDTGLQNSAILLH